MNSQESARPFLEFAGPSPANQNPVSWITVNLKTKSQNEASPAYITKTPDAEAQSLIKTQYGKNPVRHLVNTQTPSSDIDWHLTVKDVFKHAT